VSDHGASTAAQRDHDRDVQSGPAFADRRRGVDHGLMATHDPYESMDPDDFEPVRRPRWVFPAALVCLVAAVMLVVLSI